MSIKIKFCVDVFMSYLVVYVIRCLLWPDDECDQFGRRPVFELGHFWSYRSACRTSRWSFIYENWPPMVISHPWKPFFNFISGLWLFSTFWAVLSRVQKKYVNQSKLRNFEILCSDWFIFFSNSGTACMLMMFVEAGSMASIVLPLFGKAALTGGYGGIYVYTAELFPTTIRYSASSRIFGNF